MSCTQIVFCICFDIQNNLCIQHVLSLQFSCTELLSYCGLVDARISASEKDLPVPINQKSLKKNLTSVCPLDVLRVFLSLALAILTILIFGTAFLAEFFPELFSSELFLLAAVTTTGSTEGMGLPSLVCNLMTF